MNAVVRAKAILIDPRVAWARIEKESGDAAYLLPRYVALLALIPALSWFIGVCLIGVVAADAHAVRVPILEGVLGAIFGYVATFAEVLLVALAMVALAPAFDGRRDFAGALKLAVYSFTPAWLAGVFLLLPGLRFLVLFGLYGAYLLATGLPLVMKSPEPKSQAFAALMVLFAGALTLLIDAAQGNLFGPAGS